MISSYNEWDAIKSIMIGSATGANWPSQDPVFAQESIKTTWKETPVPSGPVPQHIIDESNQDLDGLQKLLFDLGVEMILRPPAVDFAAIGGMYNYCPRDRLIVYGTKIIDCAMMYPCRDQEINYLKPILDEATEVIHMPRDQGLILDAANICRLNDTWLFLESASGNRAAYDWLCEQFPELTIELCNFYAGVHIDSTIVPLREGLVMLNASRVTPDTCPRAFDSWDKIWVEDVVAQGFYQYPYASKWIAMNMLTVDPNTVIVDRHQTELIRTLESYNFTVAPHELRHSRTLGGGFHCVTLDLIRGSH
jgi:scyllo-inosamine-4-phosphate amidinotransferase 1